MAKAGAWYTSNPARLAELVDRLLRCRRHRQGGARRADPHAGPAVGPHGARVWSRVTVPDVVIVLAPVHSFSGPRALSGAGVAHPRTRLPTDTDLVKRVRNCCPTWRPADCLRKHEVEYNLPFLWRKNPNAAARAGLSRQREAAVLQRWPRDLDPLGQGHRPGHHRDRGGRRAGPAAHDHRPRSTCPHRSRRARPQGPVVHPGLRRGWPLQLHPRQQGERVREDSGLVGMVALKELGAEPLAWTAATPASRRKDLERGGLPRGVLWR